MSPSQLRGGVGHSWAVQKKFETISASNLPGTTDRLAGPSRRASGDSSCMSSSVSHGGRTTSEDASLFYLPLPPPHLFPSLITPSCPSGYHPASSPYPTDSNDVHDQRESGSWPTVKQMVRILSAKSGCSRPRYPPSSKLATTSRSRRSSTSILSAVIEGTPLEPAKPKSCPALPAAAASFSGSVDATSRSLSSLASRNPSAPSTPEQAPRIAVPSSAPSPQAVRTTQSRISRHDRPHHTPRTYTGNDPTQVFRMSTDSNWSFTSSRSGALPTPVTTPSKVGSTGAALGFISGVSARARALAYAAQVAEANKTTKKPHSSTTPRAGVAQTEDGHRSARGTRGRQTQGHQASHIVMPTGPGQTLINPPTTQRGSQSGSASTRARAMSESGCSTPPSRSKSSTLLSRPLTCPGAVSSAFTAPALVPRSPDNLSNSPSSGPRAAVPAWTVSTTQPARSVSPAWSDRQPSTDVGGFVTPVLLTRSRNSRAATARMPEPQSETCLRRSSSVPGPDPSAMQTQAAATSATAGLDTAASPPSADTGARSGSKESPSQALLAVPDTPARSGSATPAPQQTARPDASTHCVPPPPATSAHVTEASKQHATKLAAAAPTDAAAAVSGHTASGSPSSASPLGTGEPSFTGLVDNGSLVAGVLRLNQATADTGQTGAATSGAACKTAVSGSVVAGASSAPTVRLAAEARVGGPPRPLDLSLTVRVPQMALSRREAADPGGPLSRDASSKALQELGTPSGSVDTAASDTSKVEIATLDSEMVSPVVSPGKHGTAEQNVEEALEVLQTAHAALQAQLKATAERLDQVQAQLAARDDTVTSLQEQIQSRDEQIQDLRQQLQRHGSMLMSVEQLLQESHRTGEQLKAQLQQREASCADLQTQLQVTSAELAAARESVAGVHQELQRTAEQLAAEREAAAATRQQLQRTSTELAAEREAATATRQQLEKTTSELAAEREAAATARQQLQRTSTQLTAARQSAAATRHELHSTNSELAIARQSAAATRQQLQNTSSELAAERHSVSATQVQLQHMAAELAATRQALLGLTAALAAESVDHASTRHQLVSECAGRLASTLPGLRSSPFPAHPTPHVSNNGAAILPASGAVTHATITSFDIQTDSRMSSSDQTDVSVTPATPRMWASNSGVGSGYLANLTDFSADFVVPHSTSTSGTPVAESVMDDLMDPTDARVLASGLQTNISTILREQQRRKYTSAYVWQPLKVMLQIVDKVLRPAGQ